MIHEDVCLDPSFLLGKILHCHKEHSAAWRVSPRLLNKVPATSFLLGNFHRMTFDVAIRPFFYMSTVVLFHSNGDILCAWTLQSSSSDPLIGEADGWVCIWVCGSLEDCVAHPQLAFLDLLFSSLFSLQVLRANNVEAHSLLAWVVVHSFSGDLPPSFILNRGLWKFSGVKAALAGRFFS